MLEFHVRHSLLGAALVLALSAVTAHAVTPSQTMAAELKAKSDNAARQRAANDTKNRSDAKSKAQAVMAARVKAQAIGNLAVHNETKRRLEATRSAAALHERIRTSQMAATARGRDKVGVSEHGKSATRVGQAIRAKSEAVKQ